MNAEPGRKRDSLGVLRGQSSIWTYLGKSLAFLSPKDRRVYWFFVLARVLTNGLDVFGLLLVGFFGAMVAERIGEASTTSIVGITVNVTTVEPFLWVIGTVVSVFLLKSFLAASLLRANGLFLAGVETRVAVTILRHLFSGGLGRVKKHSPSKIQYAVATSAATATSHLLQNLGVLVAEGSLFVMVFVAFTVADWQAALGVFVYFLFLVLLFQWAITRRLSRAGREMAFNTKAVAQNVLDMIRSYREIQTLGKWTPFFSLFKTFRHGEARTQARVRFFDGLPRFFVESALMFGVLALAAFQFTRGDLTTGLTTTAVFLAGGVRMMSALLPLQNAISWIRVNGPLAHDAHTLYGESVEEETQLSLPSSTHDLEIQPGPLGLHFDGVTFAYEDATLPAVTNLSFEAKPGLQTAIIGPSGAGKTTVVDLALGLLVPQDGNISVGGVSPGLLTSSLPGLVSYVPQKPGMVGGSLAENVALGEPKDKINDDRVKEVLSVVGLDSFVKRSGGLWGNLGEHSDGLSGGQLQRLGLARALYHYPRLIVLDEATSALDAGSEAEITEYLGRLRGSVTTIVIAHRLSTVQNADNVLVLEDGQLLGSGSFSQVRKEVPLVETYVNLMKIE